MKTISTAAKLTIVTLAVAGAVGASRVAHAAALPLSQPTIVTHFDLGSGQLPENIALDGRGSEDVSFAGSRQVARVDPSGATTILGTLPAPDAADGQNTPVLHFPLATGLVRTREDHVYVLYAAGTGGLTGLWEINAGSSPRQVAALPTTSLPNGMALSPNQKDVYVADSALGVVYRINLASGAVTTWASGAELEPTGFLGANGLKVHEGAVWVSNLDRGTVLRIPLEEDGRAGALEVVASDLVGIDDFAFTGQGDTILAALNQPNVVDLVQPGRGRVTVLTAADGLEGPTAVAVRGATIYVTSAAYNTQQDPNLITAQLVRG